MMWKKVLSCLVIGMLLMNMFPVSVFASKPILTRIRLQDATFEWRTNQSLIAKLVDENGQPLSGKEIIFYQKTAEGWKELGSSMTNESGVAEYKLYVTMKDGSYYFKATFKGDEEYLPSSDIAEIVVIGDINPATIAIIGALFQLIVVPTIMLVAEIYKEQKHQMREDVQILENELKEWESKPREKPPKDRFPEYYEAESKCSFYSGMITISAKNTGTKLVDNVGNVIYLTLDEYKRDIELAKELREKGKTLYNTGTEEEKKWGAEMYVMGTMLLLELTYRVKEIPELKESGTVSGTLDPTVEFSIDVTPEKGWYKPGDTVKTTIRVTNNRKTETEIWLGVSFRDRNGVVYHVSGEDIAPNPNIKIAPNTMEEFTVEWTIPDNAPVGPYEIAVNCWKDYTFTDKYTDDFEWETLFYVPEFHITASPEKIWYQPGEKVVITINVENLGADKNIWFDATLIDPQGNLQYPDITPNPDNVFIANGETKTFTAEWTIPQDAPLGAYSLFINCYKEKPSPGVCPLSYADDFDQKVAFYCYNLDILSPTTSSPVMVGDPSNPIEFNVKVTTGIPIPLDLPGVFSAKINDKPAKVITVSSPIDAVNGIYVLQIAPPTQAAEGRYDLNISLDIGHGVTDSDVETDAVIYSTGGNIDVVEVIDRSGSMSGEKIQSAKDSAKLFVDLMRINDSIGVVSYSSSASVNYGLTKITSETIKRDAKNAIDRISAGGSTSIGAGLRAAYNELVNKGDPTRPRAIVLMSDGWQNTPPHPDEVLPDIKSANIRVFTIGLGAGADADLLSRIAHETGGEYYYSPSPEELSAIYNAIAGVVKAESTVKTITGSIQQGETITHKVDIDPTINIATFTVTWTSGTLNLGLERPDGSKVDPSDPDVLSHTKGATYETYTVDNPVIGEWTMKITAPSTSSSTKTTTSNLPNAGELIANKANNTMNDNWSTEIDVPARVMSVQKAAQAGISYTATVTATTNLTVHMYTDKDIYSLNEPIKIITTLAKAGIPVTEANVNATIERPDNVKEYLSLYDDGKHGDCAALDGVYANYYTNTNVSGSYTITVHASGTASPEEFTREVKKSVYVSAVPAGEISVTPTSWDTGIVHPGEDVILAFTVSSTSTKNETVMVSATDLTDAHGNVIGSENIMSMPSTFVVPAGGSGVFYERIYVPETAKTGNYTGSIVITSTANSVNIPITLQVKKLFETDIPNVELLYADPTVTSINVTLLNLSEVNETYKPKGITPLYAYMINSTGAGNFTLRFTNIPNANTIIVYKIDPTSVPPNQWIKLDATTTADTITFTMSVGDPPVVFCSGAQPAVARVPTLTPIGIIALAGLLLVIGISRIKKRK